MPGGKKMKMNVQAKASEFKFATKVASDNCISKYPKYGIECEILEYKWGILSDSYDLLLEGTEENIESFLSFLHMKGFLLKKF